MSKASLRNWFLTVLLTAASANLAICSTLRAETEVVSPEGYVESFPYAKWFFSLRDSSANELLFRMYGNEGMARNLFVLSCRRQDKRPITVEFIPPKALEERLRITGPATPKRTAVKIFNAESRGASEGGPIFESAGEYDKIAVFVDLSPERQLFRFLQLLANQKRSLFRWEQAKIEYLLENNEFATDQFISNFRESLLQARHEELSYQDVYIRCSTFSAPSIARLQEPQEETAKIYILASPPTSQLALVLNGQYYSFGREPPEVQCDLRYNGGCYWKTGVKFVQTSKNIISINGGKAFGCSPSIIPDTSKALGYESGYGKCTSKGWKSLRNDL